jgi:hypothetical protein
MTDDLNTIIGYQVQGTAEWRRRKAEEFPTDPRNLKAAEELERLADEIGQFEGSAIHQQIRQAIDGLNNLDYNWNDGVEAEADELRSIGFHSGYDTGLQFLEWFRDLLWKRLQDQVDSAVPTPDLDEQVANDPAVKAAKQAYDEAYAKAYAEARKIL